MAPPTGNRPFSITADLTLGAGANGVIVNRGSANGGYALFVRDRHLVFDYNYFHQHTQVVASDPLPAGACLAGARIDRAGPGGTVTLLIDGAEVGSVAVPEMATMVSSTGLDVGRADAPVCHDLSAPAAFEGVLRSVTFDIASARGNLAAREAAVIERVTHGQQ